MRDVLTLAEQSCRSGHNVEFGHSYGINCECLPQKISRNGFTRPKSHGLNVSNFSRDCRPRSNTYLPFVSARKGRALNAAISDLMKLKKKDAIILQFCSGCTDYHGFQGSQPQAANHRKFLSWQATGVFYPSRDRETDGDRSEGEPLWPPRSTMILIAYRHGLRDSELCDLRWHQVELASGRLHVRHTKRGTPSVHPMLGDEIRALRRLQREQPIGPHVFATERGGPMAPKSFHTLISRLGERAKMPFYIHPHMLRHACGYALANAGHDTRALQAWLGDGNIQHTVRYTELAPDRFRNFWRS